MTFMSFSAPAGARPHGEGHPRVGIVVTDGQSASKQATVDAAMRAHEADITMFAVGKSQLAISNINFLATLMGGRPVWRSSKYQEAALVTYQ